MRKGFLLLALVFVSFGLKAQHFSQNSAVVKIKTSAICTMCKERIERDLSLSKGIEKAELNLDTKVLEVRYNTKKTNPALIKSTISKIGYDADTVVADQKAHNRLPECCQKDGHGKMKE